MVMIETERMETEDIIEVGVKTPQQEVIEKLEKPTIEYIWKGARFKKNKEGKRVPVDTTKLKWKEDEEGNIIILDSVPKKKGVMVATVIDDTVAVGYTLCNFKFDKYDFIKGLPEPAFGIKVAIERATKWKDRTLTLVKSRNFQNTSRSVIVPQSIEKNLLSFIDKCMRYKKYEGLRFPAWVLNLKKSKLEREIYE